MVAVPGAGKTFVILQACLATPQKRCLVVAYNRALCDATRRQINDLGLSDRVVCYTFHGLATYCVGPTYDDVALHELLEWLKHNKSPVCFEDIDCVIIDEVQDLKESFYLLIPHLVTLRDDTQYMTVGDGKQMLYDYDKEDPACLKYLEDPKSYFNSRHGWTRVNLHTTYRCPPRVAEFISKAFDIEFQSAVSDVDARVETHTVSLWGNPGHIILKTIDQYWRENTLEKCAVLVPYKRNNHPLRAAVNFLSRKGVPIYIHGIDGLDSRVRKGKLLVGTWHSAKGTEVETAIILGISDRATAQMPNAAFVALTRARRHLVVINDRKDPCATVLKGVRGTIETTGYDAETQKLLQMDTDAVMTTDGIDDCDDCDDDPVETVVSLDSWQPSGSARWLTRAFSVEIGNEEGANDGDGDDNVIENNGDHQDVSELYRISCLMAIEREYTGEVLRWMDIETPNRLSKRQQCQAVCAGRQARFVHERAPSRALLDHQIQDTLLRIIKKDVLSINEWCFVAATCMAWSSYHHQLYQLQVSGFQYMTSDKLDAGKNVVRQAVASDWKDGEFQQFDSRLCATVGAVTFHMRADAHSKRCAYLFVWNPVTRYDELRAALLATLHSNMTCECHNLRTGAYRTVRVALESRESVLRHLIEEMVRKR